MDPKLSTPPPIPPKPEAPRPRRLNSREEIAEWCAERLAALEALGDEPVQLELGEEAA
jgi:hypothetical protein